MAITCSYPTAKDSFSRCADTGDHTPIKAIADAVRALETQVGIKVATASTPITMATAVTIYASQGSVRTISTVGVAGGCTITISSAGATQGQLLTIVKTANAATGAIVIDGITFTTKKRFGAQFVFNGVAWYTASAYQYA
jgi:hypothetical protein